MARKIFAVSSLAFLLALGCGAPPPGLSQEKLHRVDAVIEDMIAKNKIAGEVILVAKDGEVVFTGVYGKMDLEADKPMKADTIFRIYSMSKAIVTAAALTLVEEGKLKLDAPVGDVIVEMRDLQVATAEGNRKPSRPPTIQDLMLHTAGMSYGNADRPTSKDYLAKRPGEATSMGDFGKRMASIPLAFDPGKDWLYSYSIDVLGLAVERASGKPLGEFLDARIFKPLDMHDTGFWVPAEKADRFAANYQRSDQGLKVIDKPSESKYLKPPAWASGGGGLAGTARDYMRFLLMIENGGALEGHRILKASTVKLMTTNQLPKEAFPIYFGKEKRHETGFGLGFSVRSADSAWDPAARVGEYGWGGAASTHYWVSPNDRLVVVTMEQTMPYSFDTEFAVKGLIYDALLNR